MTYNLRNRVNTIAAELTITNNIQCSSFSGSPFILEWDVKRSSGSDTITLATDQNGNQVIQLDDTKSYFLQLNPYVYRHEIVGVAYNVPSASGSFTIDFFNADTNTLLGTQDGCFSSKFFGITRFYAASIGDNEITNYGKTIVGHALINKPSFNINLRVTIPVGTSSKAEILSDTSLFIMEV